MQREKAVRGVASREALTALRAIQKGSARAPEAPLSQLDRWPRADVGMAIPQMQANTRQRHDVLRPTARHYADREAPVPCIDDAIPQT